MFQPICDKGLTSTFTPCVSGIGACITGVIPLLCGTWWCIGCEEVNFGQEQKQLLVQSS